MARLRRTLSRSTRWLPSVLLCAGVLVLTGLPARPSPTYADRTAVGERWREEPFAIGVVWPSRDRPAFVEGARLAWEEIDRTPGPLAGRIRLRVYAEPNDPADDALPRRIARDSNVMVVIGHAVAEHIVPASLVYEQHAIVFVTPAATNPRSTNHRFQYLFRLTPDDEQIAEALARFAASRQIKRVGVLFARTEHGESASRQFIAGAGRLGIQIAFQRSYHLGGTDRSAHDFRPLAAEVRGFAFDALFIADAPPRGSALVRDLARMGVTQPILATDPIQPAAPASTADGPAPSVFVATDFDPSSPTPEYRAFRSRFVQRYGVDPSYEAAQGYESFVLAARAVQASRTAAPLVLATTIRLAPAWHGLFGRFAFSHDGDLIGRPVVIGRFENGRLQPEFTWQGPEREVRAGEAP